MRILFLVSMVAIMLPCILFSQARPDNWTLEEYYAMTPQQKISFRNSMTYAQRKQLDSVIDISHKLILKTNELGKEFDSSVKNAPAIAPDKYGSENSRSYSHPRQEYKQQMDVTWKVGFFLLLFLGIGYVAFLLLRK